jgi:hypothetical protein
MRLRLGLTTAVLALAVGSALADHPGEFRSACQYRGDYGQYRWSVKIDSEMPPRSIPTGVEIPAGRRWCSLRQVAFGWTEPKFPITTARRELPLTKHPVISVVGKAFWDGQHAPAAKSRGGLRRNRRTYDSTCSAWEIHPVMVLTVLRRDT